MVGWYNGHPAFTDLPIDLRRISEVSVIGQGNVALDVARILLKPVDSLRNTDVPEHVLQVLAESDVRRVSAVGRRGPGQVAFTTKEFREMTHIPDLGFAGIDPALEKAAKEMVKGDRMRTRLLGLMAKMAGTTGKQEFVLDFLKSPKAFRDTTGTGNVDQIDWVHNELVQGENGQGWSARETSETSSSRADMVVESVGYRSEPLGPVGGEVWTLPFDERKGRVSNVGGRVVDQSGSTVSPSPRYM
jgi:adrenodoxin-NADP+ reductase